MVAPIDSYGNHGDFNKLSNGPVEGGQQFVIHTEDREEDILFFLRGIDAEYQLMGSLKFKTSPVEPGRFKVEVTVPSDLDSGAANRLRDHLAWAFGFRGLNNSPLTTIP